VFTRFELFNSTDYNSIKVEKQQILMNVGPKKLHLRPPAWPIVFEPDRWNTIDLNIRKANQIRNLPRKPLYVLRPVLLATS
jgi:hypothetical protein